MRLLTPLLPSVLLLAAAAAQSPAPPAGPAADPLPVREVTVFKDGHAWVLRERPLAAADGQEVVLDELPQPLVGAFWPYAVDGARLVSAKAGMTTVRRDATVMDLRQLARANAGKDALVVTADKERLEGKLLGVPSRETLPSASDGELLLLQTAQGTRALPLGMVRELEVRGDYQGRIAVEDKKPRLTLRLAGGGPQAKVGVMYVQRGLRWIPAYRIDIDGDGKAKAQFEATLVNDLIDLQAATVNLVVGVPRFDHAGEIDPIALQQEGAQVAEHLGRRMQPQAFSNRMSNAFMAQAASPASDAAGGEPEPVVEGGAGAEDLFVFTLRDVTLKKGERMVLPIAAFELPYRDLYRLDVSFAPPMEVRQGLQSQQLVELARQLAAPKVRHVLRLTNTGDAPLTTAPALVLAGGKLLAQGTMLYTPRGGATDLEINVAVDVKVDTEEREVKRDPGPFRLGDDQYARVDVAGTIKLTNRKPKAIEVEVTRRALGLADTVGQGGAQKQLDLVQAWQGGSANPWWGWWSWPHWWFQHNGFAEFRWTATVAPGGEATFDAGWHYFWR
ncbi:MAG: hypothetical protein ACK5AL_15395 [Planctomycetota bacterium]